MALIDPKYANLPGIAKDQPDVYESGDLPESEQPVDTSEEFDSESVEQLKLQPDEAFQKFKGKGLQGKVDFSDKITRSKRTGYIALTEYELLGDGSKKETPLQKYQRLQHELRELSEECNAVTEDVTDSSGDKVSPVQLAKQVEYLQVQLADLHLENILGQETRLDLADLQGALHKRLLGQLDAFNNDLTGDKKTAKPETDGQVSYHLYCKPEENKFANKAQMAALDQRLERLEAVIGQNPEVLSALTVEVANKSVVGAVADLTCKTNLFEPECLELVDARLSSLAHKLNQLAEKKEQVEQVEKMSKVAALYDQVNKWETLAGAVPHLVERLTALRDLHQQALQFSQALSYLDTSQQKLDNNLKAHTDMLKQVDDSLKSNVKQVEENCKSLATRMDKLKK